MTNTNPPETVNTPPARPERKATLRLAQRELTLISLGVIAFIVIALGFAVYRVFLNFKSQRDIGIAQSNLNAIWKAMQGYAQDWDGHLPAAAVWTDSVAGYLVSNSGSPEGRMSALHGPGDNGMQIRYVYNSLLSGYNMERPDTRKFGDPSRLVVLIEKPDAPPNAQAAIPSQDSAEGETVLAPMLTFPHYADDSENATTLILYADGHIQRAKRRDFSLK